MFALVLFLKLALDTEYQEIPIFLSRQFVNTLFVETGTQILYSTYNSLNPNQTHSEATQMKSAYLEP